MAITKPETESVKNKCRREISVTMSKLRGGISAVINYIHFKTRLNFLPSVALLRYRIAFIPLASGGLVNS